MTAVWIALGGVAVAAAALSIIHILLYKRDPRGAAAWLSVCLTLPIAGPALYAVFGINSVRRRALEWKALGRRLTATNAFKANEQLALPRDASIVEDLHAVGDRITHRPVVPGNRVTPLINGEAAYAAMLEAIDGAKSSVHLATFIFDTDATGRRFTDALIAAANRGVQVRVLLDGMGEKYSWPRAHSLLRRTRVHVGFFLPLRHGASFNLRNHRKILVTDGTTGFTGGMNIGDRHLTERPSRKGPIHDIHFRVDGPVVTDFQRVFLEDWFFATGEMCDQAELFPPISPAGTAAARAIDDGPDEQNRKLHWILMGAMAAARTRIRIMTPYFIPGRALLGALGAAALRGVRVEVVLPGTNNLFYMHRATRAYLAEIISFGIEVSYQPPPFRHSKLLIIDERWSLVGSANLDPRSLRLNFELGLEVYDEPFARTMAAHFDDAAAKSRRVTLQELASRPLASKLLDGAFKLASPYL